MHGAISLKWTLLLESCFLPHSSRIPARKPWWKFLLQAQREIRTSFWQGHGFWAERPSNVLKKIPAHKNARPLVKIHHLIFHLVLKRKNPAGIVHGKLPRLIQGNRVLGALKKGNAQKVFQFLKGAGKGQLLFILYAQMRIQNEMILGVPLRSHCSLRVRLQVPLALHSSIRCAHSRTSTPPSASLTLGLQTQKPYQHTLIRLNREWQLFLVGNKCYV